MIAFAVFVAIFLPLLAWFLMRPRRLHVIALPRPLAAIMYRKGDCIRAYGRKCRVVSVDHAGNSLLVREVSL